MSTDWNEWNEYPGFDEDETTEGLDWVLREEKDDGLEQYADGGAYGEYAGESQVWGNEDDEKFQNLGLNLPKTKKKKIKITPPKEEKVRY
ncbi:hypothetical protein AgCh_010727 [Apium graveolens]